MLFKYSLVIFIVLLFLVSFAARFAGPNNILYPIKVNGNEVTWSLVVSAFPQTHANYQIERMSKRFSDVETGYLSSQMNPGTLFIIKSHLQDHALSVKADTDTLLIDDRITSALEVLSHEEAVVTAQMFLLGEVQKQDKRNQVNLEDFALSVADMRDGISSQREGVETTLITKNERPDLIATFDSHLFDISTYLDTVQAQFDAQANGLPSSYVEHVAAQLTTARDTLNMSRSEFGSDHFAESFIAAQRSYRIAEIEQILLQQFKELNITPSN